MVPGGPGGPMSPSSPSGPWYEKTSHAEQNSKCQLTGDPFSPWNPGSPTGPNGPTPPFGPCEQREYT